MRVWSVHQKVINLEVGDELLALALPQAGGSSRFLTLSALPDVVPGDVFYPASVDIHKVATWQGPLPSDARAQPTSQCLDSLAEALRILDIRPSVDVLGPLTPKTVDRWIGLGPGLTPAGDDVVLGYLAADNHLGQDIEWTKAMHKAVFDVLGQTTTLSAQMLRDALRCDYHESIQRVIAILCALSSENLLTALRCLTRIGASSGASMVYGMQLALERR